MARSGMTGFGRGTRLDFDENQQIAAARHDIDFRIGAGPIVSGDDGKAHFA